MCVRVPSESPQILFCCWFAKRGGERVADFSGTLHRVNPGGTHRGVLVFRRALASADDRSGVAHAAARRRGLSGDETDNRFLYAGFDEFGGDFFRVPADFADHDDGMRVGIVVEQVNRVEERGADDGIAADADAGGLADAETRELVHGFVRQSAAAAHQSNVALLVNPAGHDPDFAFAGRDDARTIRADQARFRSVHGCGHAHHVERRNAFGNAYDERQTCVGGFENGIGSERRRYKDNGGVRASFSRGFGKRVEHRTIKMLGATLAGSHAANNVGAVFDHLPGVKTALTSRESLDEEARLFVDEDTHRAPPASATTFSAPSFMPSAIPKWRPESRRIFFPSSTFVPSSRTTMGILSCKSLAAATTPVARTSQRRMPPKMLMKTARTEESLIKIVKAFFTCSADAPPPTSTKFAGAPPESLMLAIVAIARPAPFTMRPTLPASLM